MKINVKEDNNRRIGSKEHNQYVARGVNEHRKTHVAPPSLIQPLDSQLNERIKIRHKTVERLLEQVIGRPLFSEAGFMLYQGNCAVFLQQLLKCHLVFDLTVTSPPYNIGKEYEEPRSLDDYIGWCSDWIDSIYAVTEAHGAFWLNVGFLEVQQKGLCVPIPYLLWDKTQFYLLQEIVWRYGAGVAAKQRFSPRNEKWLFYVKDPQHYTFNLDEVRDPNVKYPNQKRNGKFRCHPLGKNPSDVWEFPKVTTGERRSSKERTGHPAQFPLGVVERIVKASSNPLDIVLDPFAGSCSAGIAAVGLGRIFVGFEVRLDYCQLAVERFRNFQKERQYATAQGVIF